MSHRLANGHPTIRAQQTENLDEEIEPIYGPLIISTDPFTLEEHRIAKTSINEEKSLWR